MFPMNNLSCRVNQWNSQQIQWTILKKLLFQFNFVLLSLLNFIDKCEHHLFCLKWLLDCSKINLSYFGSFIHPYCAVVASHPLPKQAAIKPTSFWSCGAASGLCLAWSSSSFSTWYIQKFSMAWVDAVASAQRQKQQSGGRALGAAASPRTAVLLRWHKGAVTESELALHAGPERLLLDGVFPPKKYFKPQFLKDSYRIELSPSMMHKNTFQG